MINVLMYFLKKYKQNWQLVMKALSEQEEIKEDDFIVRTYKDAIPITDNKYFNKFKDIDFPPFVIFYKGDINIINESKVLSLYSTYDDEIIKQLNEVSEKIEILCVLESQINLKILKKINALEIKIIMISSKSINDSSLEKYLKYTDLILSEIYYDEVELDKFQTTNRILYALCDKLILNQPIKETMIEFDKIHKNTSNNDRKCYYLNNNEQNKQNIFKENKSINKIKLIEHSFKYKA